MMTPPITARPNGARKSAPSPAPMATGIIPAMSAIVVIMMGRKRSAAGFDKSFSQRHSRLVLPLRKVDEKNGILGDDSHQQHDPNERHHVQRVAGNNKRDHYSDERERQRDQDGNKIEEGTKLHDKNQVHEQNGNAKHRKDVTEEFILLLDLPAIRDVNARRQLHAGNDLVDILRYFTQRTPLRIAFDVDDTILI